MSVSHEVFIHYAAYEACGLVDHRTSRLAGMKIMLEKGGHTVELIQSPKIRNLVELFVHDIRVFNCDIRDLDYGGDGELDSLCHDALNEVNKAY